MKTFDNIAVPFFAEVKDGIPRTGEVEIEGTVLAGKDQAIWFEFRNFDGIPLHLNIRMGYQKEHITVVNSYDRGRWRREERHGNNVSPGGPIHLQVINHRSKWEIKINGSSYNFSHRLSTKDIRRLEIRGDIQINRLNLKNLDKHVELYQSSQVNSPPPQPSFNPTPYAPSSSPPMMYPMQAGTGPTITPGNYQPYPSEPTPNHQGFPPNPNSMYPNLEYGEPQQNAANPHSYY